MSSNGVMTITDNGLVVETENNLSNKHQLISDIPTPKFFVKDKGGMDYVDEAYMRKQLNEHYPIWKWEIMNYEFKGDKVIVVHGRLTILDHSVERYFDSVAAHRIAVSKNSGEYVDIGNDLKAANSDAFKLAVNRLCNIADDVYRKQVPDLELSKKQLETLEKLISEVDSDVGNKVSKGVQDGSINSTNYEATTRRLQQIKGE